MQKSLFANQNIQGQVFVEFALGLLLFIIFFIGSVRLMSSQWEQLKCKKNTFELAHQKLMRSSSLAPESEIDQSDTIRVIQKCHSGLEEVKFKKLSYYKN